MTKRILSGMRPTGLLHLGHYFGVLQEWLRVQEDGEAFFFVADWHALTTEYENVGAIQGHVTDMVRDWLAVGIDPEQSTIFRQSDVKQHAELHLLLSMVTPVSWLERVPSYKDMIANLQDKNLGTYGFLGYPLLQAADIIIYQADVVPVGEDQVAHLELTREVVRRFHHLYDVEIFPEPAPRLTKSPKVPGTDGRKMSKSYDNAIYLADGPDVLEQKVRVMVTDPGRVRRTDPGNPDICDVYALHQTATEPPDVAQIGQDCRSAQIGCVDCKKKLAGSLNQVLDPIRERRGSVSDKDIQACLGAGAATAAREAESTMVQVRGAVGMPGGDSGD